MEHSITSIFEVAEITLAYRSAIKPSNRPQINSSQDTYNILTQLWDGDRIELAEQFKVLLLNRASRVLGIYELSTGGLTGTVADPRLIFAAAIKANAPAVILAHNHPSGNLQPSQADILLTNKIVEGGKLLDIAVIDHLIVTIDGYYSFADEGMI